MELAESFVQSTEAYKQCKQCMCLDPDKCWCCALMEQRKPDYQYCYGFIPNDIKEDGNYDE